MRAILDEKGIRNWRCLKGHLIYQLHRCSFGFACRVADNNLYFEINSQEKSQSRLKCYRLP